MRNGYRGLLISLLPTAILGCASTTELTTRYLTDTPVEPAKRLLLVARTPETEVRERWEKTCSQIIDSSKLELIPSYTALPLWYEAGNEHILSWAKAHNVDAILIAELTGLLLAPPQIPPQNFMQSERGMGEDTIGDATWSFFIGRKEKDAPLPSEIHEVEFQLITADEATLWNGIAATHEANELEAITTSQCKALKRNLDGLRLLP